MSDARRMGDLFTQRRAARARGGVPQQQERTRGGAPQQQERARGGAPPQQQERPSLLDIQAEQRRESTNHRAPRGRRQHRGKRDHARPVLSNLPLEQGSVVSLEESFGFIHCADRPEQLFFHFSETGGVALQVDDEVEFRVGPARNEPDKMSAYNVRRLEPGTIEWELEEEPGTRYHGLVERSARGPNEGTIRMLVAHEGEEEEEEEVAAAAAGPLIRYTASDYAPPEEDNKKGGELRRFDSIGSSSSRGGGGGGRGLARNDLVEFTMVKERRTGDHLARSITLLQSDRDRQRVAREKEMMKNATLEQGVVTSLKTGFGFIRSNRRREEVYFRYTNVEVPHNDEEEASSGDEEDGDDEEHHEIVLQEGQDVEFLVVTEKKDGKEKYSAREVKFLPKGSVVFHKVVAEGVTGVITRMPHPADSTYSSEMVGRVALEDKMEDGTTEMVGEILFYSADSPGGCYCNNRECSCYGLWVREGDRLLFDVVKDVVDGSFRVAPTKHLKPAASESTEEEGKESTAEEGKESTAEEGKESTAEEGKKSTAEEGKKSTAEEGKESTAEEGKSPDAPDDDKAVRLLEMSPAGRADGFVHAIKEGYGFITCSERAVDAYFRTYEVLPESIQNDMRRNMGIVTSDDNPLELKLGVQVQFDLSLQGTVAAKPRGRHGATTRENLKGQRLLLLPPSTIMENKVIAKDAKGVVSKEDAKQTYSGFIEFEETYKPMSSEERHPFVAKLLRSLLDDDSTKQRSVVYHDLQSMHEDDVVVQMVEEMGKGLLTCTHLPVAGDSGHPGRLCIAKKDVSSGDDNKTDVTPEGSPEKVVDNEASAPAQQPVEASRSDDHAESTKIVASSSHSKSGRRKQKRPKHKDIKSVHFDKHCLAEKSLHDVPPGKGDVVLCDIVQLRRTGTVELRNLRVIERSDSERGDPCGDGDASGVGIVNEIVPASKFGFISVLDENASRREMLFFQLSCVVNETVGAEKNSASPKRGPLVLKGDEVKFDIRVASSGKRTAVNVRILPKGTLNISAKEEKNACRGFVLMEPSRLPNTPAVQKGARSPPKQKGGGRWDITEDVSAAPKKSGGAEGRILLTSDPVNMFAIRKFQKKESVEGTEPALNGDETESANKEEPKEVATNNGVQKSAEIVSAIGTHVNYKNGAIAICGAGASSTSDATSNPRRGDLVSFMKVKHGSRGARDIRIVERGAATLQRGRLEDINLAAADSKSGTAKFIAATDKEEEYEIDLAEVVSCDASALKDKESVEGILHNNKIFGVCRTSDLYLGNKLGRGHKERPKLNLVVRKELKQKGGKIQAQSMNAKGPDGTNGFPRGWTTRVSQYSAFPAEKQEDAPEEAQGAEAAPVDQDSIVVEPKEQPDEAQE